MAGRAFDGVRKRSAQAGKLVVCGTPLGNMGDMTPRVVEALGTADAVCAEDTRVTGRLLKACGVNARLERMDENVIAQRAASVVERVLSGQTIAYCTDAGMPGVSDPGLRLVRACREAGAAVEVLPGPTAATCAYVASGCIDTRFFFGGFFPRKESERVSELAALRSLDAALIFYESPKRLVSALRSIERELPGRELAVCRELTKLHEEVVRGIAGEVRAVFEERAADGGSGAACALRGEVVIVIDGPTSAERRLDQASRTEGARKRAVQLAGDGVLGRRAAEQLAREFDIPRNKAYDLALSARSELASQAAAHSGMRAVRAEDADSSGRSNGPSSVSNACQCNCFDSIDGIDKVNGAGSASIRASSASAIHDRA